MRLLDPLEHYKTLATKEDPRTVHVFQKNDDIQVEILRLRRLWHWLIITYPILVDDTYIAFCKIRISNLTSTEIKERDRFLDLFKLLVNVSGSSLIIKRGHKIDRKDLSRIVPCLLFFLPSLKIGEKNLEQSLLENQSILFQRK
jgi:hypothetical protein